ncbi:MAG: TonB-dependent receptor [Pseudomonadota bacterium]
MYSSQVSRRVHMVTHIALIGAVSLSSGLVLAHEDPVLEEVNVEGRHISLVGEARSASEGVVGQSDLALRPLLRPGDVLEAVPGMIVTQHSGSGKSNQMFIRGFNLDHGTDFATWINGMPVNMRTHGHGQGYTDINFLIPETIQSLSFVKGPYHAELGDFSSAGGTHMRTFKRVKEKQVKLGLGENGFQRLLTIGGADISFGHLSGALEAQTYQGPWQDIDEDVRKINGLVSLSSDKTERRWSVTAMAYDNEWDSADQIPERAVQQGVISELGSLDQTLGGNSRRLSLSATTQSMRSNGSAYELNAYVIDYKLQLWSNFTYQLDNPLTGDQFEQFDDRTIWGANGETYWFNGEDHEWQHRIGADLRHDDIRQIGLYQTQQRQRLNNTREGSAKETSLGVFYELQWQMSDAWRTVVGLRGDIYDFDVSSNNPANSGSDTDSILSPKINFIYTLSENSEVYLSGGRGFHSNDARGTTITVDPQSGEDVQGVDPLVASEGMELGFKTSWLPGLNSSLAVWYLALDSELLFVGDAGTTEASRPSKRQGIEFNNYWAINDVWSLEADFAWTDSEFDDDLAEGDNIPGAIPFVASASLTAEYPEGWFGSVRIRHFDSYPLIEDNSAESDGSTFAAVATGWSNEHWRVQLDVLNLFDSTDHDIDYFYASRLVGEQAGGVEENHFKVFEPRQLRLYLGYTF